MNIILIYSTLSEILIAVYYAFRYYLRLASLIDRLPKFKVHPALNMHIKGSDTHTHTPFPLT